MGISKKPTGGIDFPIKLGKGGKQIIKIEGKPQDMLFAIFYDKDLAVVEGYVRVDFLPPDLRKRVRAYVHGEWEKRTSAKLGPKIK